MHLRRWDQHDQVVRLAKKYCHLAVKSDVVEDYCHQYREMTDQLLPGAKIHRHWTDLRSALVRRWRGMCTINMMPQLQVLTHAAFLEYSSGRTTKSL